MSARFKNCTYHEAGCAMPSCCWACGFDKGERERRRKIPLTLDSDGKRRKHITRPGKGEGENGTEN